ncbi:MAG: DNA polymerase III subunit delta, partial [Lachnospiraceae bacterium]|nr:DNA polymerase III subunit delta [Lachnospiraceae bacterium]
MNRINEDIKTGQWKQMYLLYGEEAYLRKQYRDRLKAAIAGDDAMNCNFYEGKNLPVGEVIDLAETLPFFADRRLIVIQGSGLFKSGGEELA